MARESYNRTVWDTHTSCDALWLSRGAEVSFEAVSKLLTTVSATPADVAKSLGSAKTGGSSWLGVNGNNDLISCSWSKDVESPAGVWNLMLKQRQNYFARLQPGDLMLIFMSDNQLCGQEWSFIGKLITVGLIDRIGKSVHVVEGGAEQMTVTVTGRDLGALFQETSTVFDPGFAVIEQQLFSDSYRRLVLAKMHAVSPLEQVLRLLDLMYNVKATGSQYQAFQLLLSTMLPVPLVSLIDLTSFTQAPMFGYMIPAPIALAEAGSMWTLLTQHANLLVNELFFDVRDYANDELEFIKYQQAVAGSFVDIGDLNAQYVAVTQLAASAFRSASVRGLTPSSDPNSAAQVFGMVFRQRPYDTGAFQALPQRTVWQTEVYESDVGLSGHEVYNFFRVRPPFIAPLAVEKMYGIPINANSVMRFGLRRLDADSQYFFASHQQVDAWTNSAQAALPGFQAGFDYYVGLLSVWHAANERLLSGTLTTRLRPDIRVGHRLRWQNGDEVIDFYVQALSHSFQTEAGASRSRFTLVRGVSSAAVGLEANLFWKAQQGFAIPKELSPYAWFTAYGVDVEALGGKKLVSEKFKPEVSS